jgi:hypothetical protein
MELPSLPIHYTWPFDGTQYHNWYQPSIKTKVKMSLFMPLRCVCWWVWGGGGGQRCCCIHIIGTKSKLGDGWMRKGGFHTWQRQEGFLLPLTFALALWPTHLLCNGYTIKQRTGLTMHHHLVPKYNIWRLSGAMSISSCIFLVWCVVKHRNNLTLNYFTCNSTAPYRLPKWIPFQKDPKNCHITMYKSRSSI